MTSSYLTVLDEVELVRERFAQWRQTRPGHSRNPDKLWPAAAQLARRHGVHPIARVLGLGNQALRQRLQETPLSSTAPESAASPGPDTCTPDQEDWTTLKPPSALAPTVTELQCHSAELNKNPAAWLPWNYRDILARQKPTQPH